MNSPDHARNDVHHVAVDGVPPDCEYPPLAMRDEAQAPAAASLDKVSTYAKQDCGIKEERQSCRQKLLNSGEPCALLELRRNIIPRNTQNRTAGAGIPM